MRLEEIIHDSNRLYFGGNIPERYRTDPYVLDVAPIFAVAMPINKQEVVDLVKFAIEKDLKIIARGSATSVTGSYVPIIGNELIIDFSFMNQIIDLDEETMTLTVEPGVKLEAIQAFVEERGYFYPPDPGSKDSTIGGNVSTNAGGMRAIKYGTTRDYVRSIDLVLPTGEEITLGSINFKSSSGYDLKDLFIGSEGTLGIITQLKLKVIPLPKFTQSVILAFDSVAEATDTVSTILKQGFGPTALELFERSTIEYSEKLLNLKFQSQVGNAYLLVTFDGNDQDYITRIVAKLYQTFINQTKEIILLTTKEEEDVAWILRDHILKALMEFTVFELLDEVVPINQFAEMIHHTKYLQEKYGVSVLNFGHAGDGNVHTLLMKENLDDETWQYKRKLLLDDLFQKVHELGGLPSAEHGIGILKKVYFANMTDPVLLNMMRQIKKAFDPCNRLNPHKIF